MDAVFSDRNKDSHQASYITARLVPTFHVMRRCLSLHSILFDLRPVVCNFDPRHQLDVFLLASPPPFNAIMSPSAHSDNVSQASKTTGKTPLQLISQGTPLPGIPKHPSFAVHRQWLLEKMALAFRVFHRKGYTDGMAGHISVRDPENPHTFWTVSTSPVLITPETLTRRHTCPEPPRGAFRTLEGKRHDPRQL